MPYPGPYVKRLASEIQWVGDVEVSFDRSIVVLDADVSRTTRTDRFRDTYPEKSHDMGYAEQNVYGVQPQSDLPT